MIKRLLPLAAALVMAGSAAHAQTTKLALGMSGWTGFAPLTLADKAGLFKKHGLEVELKMIPQKDRHLALASGGIQCAATTVENRSVIKALLLMAATNLAKEAAGFAARRGQDWLRNQVQAMAAQRRSSVDPSEMEFDDYSHP